MNKQNFLVATGVLLLMSGCSGPDRDDDPSDTAPALQTLSGEVYYRERKFLPPGAELNIALKDVSKVGAPATVIATSTTLLAGSQPYQFSLDYSPADIDKAGEYTLRATVTFYGELLFTSATRLDPFKRPDEAISIELRMIGSTEEQLQSAPTVEADTGLAVVSVNPLADLANTYWKLVSLNETAVVMEAEQEREAFLQLREDTGSVRGFAGCNTFTGSYTVNGNDLEFGPIAATRKACAAGMETESNFLRVLEGTAYFSIHEETLTLLNESKKPVARLVAVYFD